MNELEDRLEGFVDQMCEMVLDLLCLLDIKKIEAETTEPIEIFIFVHFLIFHLLGFETHVSADSSHVGPSPHVVIHLVKRFRVGSQAHIQQNGILRLQLVGNTVEKPVMGGQFSTIFVLYAEEKVYVPLHASRRFFLCALLTGLGLVEEIAG